MTLTHRPSAVVEECHRARVETVLTLSTYGLLPLDVDATGGVAEALAALGVRPPIRLLPTRDLTALDHYAIELLELIDTIARVAEDPEGLWRVDGYRADLERLIGESLAPTEEARLG